MPTLEELAAKANAAFTEADRFVNDKRLEAGRYLAEAQDQLGKGFRKWALDNIKRDISDVMQCIRMARAENPVEAREAEMAAHRESKARERNKVVGDITHEDNPTTPPSLTLVGGTETSDAKDAKLRADYEEGKSLFAAYKKLPKHGKEIFDYFYQEHHELKEKAQ